jgi:hypothetical protein
MSCRASRRCRVSTTPLDDQLGLPRDAIDDVVDANGVRNVVDEVYQPSNANQPEPGAAMIEFYRLRAREAAEKKAAAEAAERHPAT